MATVSRAWISAAAVVALALILAAAWPIWAAEVVEDVAVEVVEESAVLTLDATNFTEAVAKHPFIVVEFYAPWCGHCKRLTPEYEKAATILSKHDPPIILAKVNADDEINKELASKYEVQGFPTLKILRNEGKSIQEYNGPREADGIVEYLKKQVGPASAEIKSLDDAGSLIGEENIITVGIFPEYSGEEFEIFMLAAEKLRSDYDFGHTLDAKLLPRGDTTVTKPTIRLFKPFDELSVDFQDFSVDAIEKFIESASVPLITTFNQDPKNHPFLSKFFNSPNAKAMLFLNFSNEYVDSFNSKYREAAEINREKDIIFLIGDVDASKAAFEYFGLKEDQAPLIIIQEENAKKYLKSKVEPDQIATWIQEYKEGSLTPFKKSEPIPEVNDEPVKVVVADSVHDLVFNSKKNVLLEFYAPWCGHCKQLAPILDEVATNFKDDADVVIAKMDATANDVPSEFEVQGFPTLYFASASGKLEVYDGGRTAEDIITFIEKSKDVITQTDPVKEDVITQTDSVKDEL